MDRRLSKEHLTPYWMMLQKYQKNKILPSKIAMQKRWFRILQQLILTLKKKKTEQWKQVIHKHQDKHEICTLFIYKLNHKTIDSYVIYLQQTNSVFGYSVCYVEWQWSFVKRLFIGSKCAMITHSVKIVEYYFVKDGVIINSFCKKEYGMWCCKRIGTI